MGLPVVVLYGEADIQASISILKNIIGKIESNKFTKEDLCDLVTANAELTKAIINKDE